MHSSNAVDNGVRDQRVAGVGVSHGVAVGRALRLDERDLAAGLPADYEATDPRHEIERLRQAVTRARNQILAIKERVADELGRGHAYFFEAHLLMLEDRELLADVERVIRTRRVRAEWAVKSVLDRMLVVYAQVKDDYLRERGSDIEDIARRIIRILTGGQTASLARLHHDVIIVGRELAPSVVAELDLSRVLALATDKGGFTSHTAIIARSLGIPAVVGLSDVVGRIGSGDALVVDGSDGCVILNPTKSTIRAVKRRQRQHQREAPDVDASAVPRTRDGQQCTVRANVELPSELDLIPRYGARGIGLYRSEYIYLNSLPELPSEEDQLALYEQLAVVGGEGGVTIRSFDLGGDKLSLDGFESERNPALGLRALRLSLCARPVFKTQLRAILRASARGRLRLVLPMVSRLSELRAAKELLETAKAELRAEGKPLDPKLPVGVMIEVPSAVVIADHLAAECDFFSVGTNDLIQYLLAVDRSNQNVASIFEPLHPSVLRCLKRLVDVSTHAGIPAIVCGEMAANPIHVVVLMGLGFHRFSMTPPAIPLIKNVIQSVQMGEARELADVVLSMRTTAEIEHYLSEQLPRRFPSFFGQR
jgi:phosphotransferase system enzyme I (PtsI)